jgi:hypothetical protein
MPVGKKKLPTVMALRTAWIERSAESSGSRGDLDVV